MIGLALSELVVVGVVAVFLAAAVSEVIVPAALGRPMFPGIRAAIARRRARAANARNNGGPVAR